MNKHERVKHPKRSYGMSADLRRI